MSVNVNISIEIPDEYVVQEISYDGQEKYINPLSMSENLTRLAQRIDFSKPPDDTSPNGEIDHLENNEAKESVQTPAWPWDSFRNRLRNALTEVTVLLDVMNIVKGRKYMVLDPVSQDPPDVKPMSALIAKKKAFAAAASIILNGVEKSRLAKTEATRGGSFDFHSELMTMRQNWRLKKVGNAIIGDLSYRSAGSRYPHTGTFEVSKNEVSASSPVTRPVSLKVKVPSDLEGISYIHVCIQKDSQTITSGDLSIPLPHHTANSLDSNWQQKLENAQNVLFCRELFSQLAREAVQVELPIPTLVVGNQIIATIFPGIQLSIDLCHSSVQSKKRKLEDQKPPITRREHKPVLEHSLHQLLRELHYNALHHPMPHPSSATLGISRRRYFAGPEAYDRATVIESFGNETILEQIIAQAQHVVLRLRTMYTIDSLANEIKDPLIVAHWMCVNHPTKSSVKINIHSYGYESLCRTPAVIHIGTKDIKAICRDGRVFNMSVEQSELHHLITTLISHHQIYAVQALGKSMGWKTLDSNTNSLMLASPDGHRTIWLKHNSEGASVYLSSNSKDSDFYPNSLVRDSKFYNSNSFKCVNLEALEGNNLVGKMEYLFACAAEH